MDQLPDDLLADILRRLPLRGTAACRTVCKGWCAVIDAGGLLLAATRLVPRPMRGFLVNYFELNRPCFYSLGPTSSPRIALDSSALSFMRAVDRPETILDHRNGLLLLTYGHGRKMYVCNPATKRWAELPPPPFQWSATYLVFDPVVSLDYDVFLFRKTTWNKDRRRSGTTVEWPPRVYKVQVYSSRADQWEEWAFRREGDATMVNMWIDQAADRKRNAVYWRGALYLHCRSGLVIRFSLDKRTYLVINPPEIVMMPNTQGYTMKPQVHLGKSERGVYYTMTYQHQLRSWVLLEASKSRPTPVWVLKHHSLPAPSILRHCMQQCRERKKTDMYCIPDRGSEGLTDDSGDCDWEFADEHSDDNSEEQKEGEVSAFLWNCYVCSPIDFLGYHPYKEIAFLGTGRFNWFAHYMGTSKVRHLGTLYPTACCFHRSHIQESFIYTPCLDDLLPTHDEANVHSLDGWSR